MDEAIVEREMLEGGEAERHEMVISIPADHERQLRMHAAERRTSKRQMVRAIIAEYLAEHDKYAQQ